MSATRGKFWLWLVQKRGQAEEVTDSTQIWRRSKGSGQSGMTSGSSEALTRALTTTRWSAIFTCRTVDTARMNPLPEMALIPDARYFRGLE
jgi:hypothetical protein